MHDEYGHWYDTVDMLWELIKFMSEDDKIRLGRDDYSDFDDDSFNERLAELLDEIDDVDPNEVTTEQVASSTAESLIARYTR